MGAVSFDYGGVGGAVAESPYLDNGLGESLGGVAGAAHAPLDLPDNTLLDSLSEHWDMDETTGNRAGSEGNYDLVPTGTVSYVTGKISNAVDFGGGRIEVTPGSPALHGSLLTIALWYKPGSATPSSAETIAAIANSTTTTTWWIQHQTDGRVVFRIGDGTSLTDVETPTGEAALDTTKFNLILCQYSDAGDWSRIRVNGGGWIWNTSNTRVIQTPGRDLSVGALDAGGQAANGAVDEMAVWPALVPDSDFAWLWNAGAAYAYSNWLAGGGGSAADIAPKGSAVLTGTVELSAKGAIEAAGAAVVTGEAAASAKGAIVARGAGGMSAQVALGAVGEIEATGAAAVAGTAAVGARGAIAAAGQAASSGAAEISAKGAIVAAGAGVLVGVVEFQLPGAIVARGSATVTGTAAASATGSIQAAGAAVLEGRAASAATGSLAATGGAVLEGRGAARALVSFAASSTSSLAGAVELGAIGSFGAAGAAVLEATCTLTAGVPIVYADLRGRGRLVVTWRPFLVETRRPHLVETRHPFLEETP